MESDVKVTETFVGTGVRIDGSPSTFFHFYLYVYIFYLFIFYLYAYALSTTTVGE